MCIWYAPHCLSDGDEAIGLTGGIEDENTRQKGTVGDLVLALLLIFIIPVNFLCLILLTINYLKWKKQFSYYYF